METTNVSALRKDVKLEAIRAQVIGLKFSNGFYLNQDMQEPEKGYMVGGFSECYQNPTRENIKELFDASGEGIFIGGWRYEDINFIELSANIQDKDEAIKMGIELEQIAIYDVKSSKDIKIV